MGMDIDEFIEFMDCNGLSPLSPLNGVICRDCVD